MSRPLHVCAAEAGYAILEGQYQADRPLDLADRARIVDDWCRLIR